MGNGKLTGREIRAAFARSSTWGTPASVLRQLPLQETSGLDSMVGMVDDESFNQNFLLAAEVGDQEAIKQDIGMQLRYESVDTWLAVGMGSAAAPVVVSSVAAGSLVAYSHVVTLADELTHFLTLAVDLDQYILEVPTFKIAGFTIKVGENGRMLVDFGVVGAKTNYDSTVNINSTIGGAAAAALGTRVFRRHGVFRMNVASVGSLVATDAFSAMTDINFGAKQPLADGDHVFGQDYIIEPDNDGFPEFPIEVTFARMNTVTSNSLVTALKAGRVFKADWTFTGPNINSNTPYSMLWQFPALQVYSFRAPAVGAKQVRPVAVFRAKQAAAAPTGMAGIVRPMQLTITNMNSANLLT